jgi:hypothetical protein
VVNLNTEEDILKFLAFENEWQEDTKFFGNNSVSLGSLYTDRKTKTRVIAFVYDKEDFVDELKNLRQTAKFSAKRDDLRVSMVTDKKLIKKYKANYGTLWFPEGAYSSIVLKRYDGRTFYHDLLTGNPPMGFMFWINKKSVRDTEEMNPDTFRIFEMIRQPIVVAFVDLKSQDKEVARESIKLVDEVLPEVAPAFFHGLIIAYADNTLYNKHRKILGLNHNK